MRINKYIAQAGVASRRKADELIENGNVKVNGAVLREPGYDVQEGDRVMVNGREISGAQKMEYVLINKPLGMVTTVEDDKDPLTVMDVVKDIDARLFPVGRLDYNTSGALIMTNDGELAYRLTHPKHEVYKTYRALVSGILSNERAARLRRGVDIGGFVTSPAKVKIIKGTQHSTLVEIAIHEGKNRQVRKMCDLCGLKVQRLVRISEGALELGDLPTGTWRYLTPEEVRYVTEQA